MPTTLEGQLVMITGIIVYNFVPPMTVTQVGYELSLAEKSKIVQKYQINSINETFPPSWEKEKELLKKLDALLTEKVLQDSTPAKPATTNVNAGKFVRPTLIVEAAQRQRTKLQRTTRLHLREPEICHHTQHRFL